MKSRYLRLASASLVALLLAGLRPAPTPAAAPGKLQAQAQLPPQPAPHPCFVLPHPLKHGAQPRPETPRRHLAGQTPPGNQPLLGGAAYGYHDTHLKEGVMEGAEFPPPDTLHALGIMVDFSDQEMGAGFQADREDSVRLYFSRVLTFLDQIYENMSDTLVVIHGDLAPQIYRLPKPMSYYGLDDSIGTREAQLCYDAVQAADPDVDFSRYNRVILFHAGGGQEADIKDDSREEIWSVFFREIDFAYWLDRPGAEKGIVTGDIDPATGDTVYVTGIVVAPEYESQDGYQFGLMGTVAHEFGHSFGLPDLYDTTGPVDWIYADSQGIGSFGLMGAGIWNDNGFFPAEMDAWCKFYMGWSRPTVLRPDGTGAVRPLSLESIETDRRHGLIRIPMGGDEYLLIENRVRDYNGNGKFDFDDPDSNGVFDFWTDSYAGAELDWYLPREDHPVYPGADGSGLLIWHIDESVIRENLLYNLVNADALHKGVDLEEADGIQDLDHLEFTFEAFGDYRDSFWAPYSPAFTPLTNPNTDGYEDTHTGIWITDISAPGATMTANLRFEDPSGASNGDFRAGWPIDLPGRSGDFQPVTGDLNGDGVQELAVATVDTAGNGTIQVFEPDGSRFFAPGTGPRAIGWGKLRSDPLMVNLDGAIDPRPELVWVSGDSILAVKPDGRFVAAGGSSSSVPVPYYLLPEDPGRTHLASGYLEPPGTARLCGGGPASVNDDRPELIVGALRNPGTDTEATDVYAISWPRTGTLTTVARVVATLPGDARAYSVLADLDNIDNGLGELVSTVRTRTGGYLAVTVYDALDSSCNYEDVRTVAYSLGDTVTFTPPVAGDLNRDGVDEIVVGDSRGYLHAFDLRVHSADGYTKELGPPALTPGTVTVDNATFEELPGWPVEIGTLADDEISLADVDGDGYLEVLAFGPVNALHVLNYNGTSIVSLPVAVPAEDRYTMPFLAPMVLDITGTPDPEMLLALPDGQVRGHDLRGRPLQNWAYLGGGNQGIAPVVTDLDGDGTLELVTVEDVTTALPEEDPIRTGDESAGIPKTGRVLVREVGQATGNGPWPVFRHDAGRTGVAPVPDAGPSAGGPGLLASAFVVPNPVAARSDAGFHYEIRSDVSRVTITIYTARGEEVRALDGSVDTSTDNLVRWDLTNKRGNDVAPGLYFARLQAQAGTTTETRMLPFVLVR